MNNEVDIDQIKDPIELVYLFFDKMGIPRDAIRGRLFKNYVSYKDFVFDIFIKRSRFTGIRGHFRRMMIRKKKNEEVYLLGYFDPYSFQWDMIEWREEIYKKYFYLEKVFFSDISRLKYISRFHGYIPKKKEGGTPIERRPLNKIIRDGDIVYLGDHIVRCGDCIQYIEKVDKDIKLIYTDPPYGVDVEDIHDKGSFDNLSNEQLYNLLYNFGIEVRKRFVNKKINIPIFMWKGSKLEGNIVTYAFLSGLKGVGRESDYIRNMMLFSKNYLSSIVWCKTSSSSSQSKKFWSSTEKLDMMMTIGEYEGEKLNFDNYIIYFRPDRAYGHASIKPVFLNSFFIKATTKPSDWILDAFGGSGSTLISAEITGRRAYLIEKEPEYVEYIIARWQAYRRWVGLPTDVIIERNGEKYKVDIRFDLFRKGDNRVDIERGTIFKSRKEMIESYESKYGKIL